MSSKLNEKDIQNYLYQNLEKLPELISLTDLESSYRLNRSDLVNHPLQYLLNKKYKNIFKKMQNFSEGFHRFSIEYNTAELGNSKPRIDILSYQSDPCTFYITEVKWNNDPERQTITELLQYANGLQINDFPGLPNDDIVFIIVAKEWSNILIQSVVNGIVFKNLNILPIQVTGEEISNLCFSFFDLWNTGILENLNKQIYNEENYPTRILTFDEFSKNNNVGILEPSYEDIQIITMSTAIELSRDGYTGYVLGMEKEPNLMFKNAIAVLYFNPLSFYNKNWGIFSESKCNELSEFNSVNDYNINTNILRENIKYHYLGRTIQFEEGSAGIGITGLCVNRNLFSYGYPIGFLEILLKDLISYCKEDLNFAIQTIGTDDINGSGYSNISHWTYLDSLFNQYKIMSEQEQNPTNHEL